MGLKPVNVPLNQSIETVSACFGHGKIVDPVDHPTVQNVVPQCLVAFVHHLQNFAGIKAMVQRANPLT